MSFLSPLFLVGALAAAIPVVLHLLKREPVQRVRFAAVALLRQAPVERTSTHRLRQIILLIMRVAVLVLLAVAFAQPFFPQAATAASRRATVIALDTSSSLSAPGRFARAQRLAREAVTAVPASDDVGVVTFADRAELVVPPSADRASALAAIDGAAAGFGATRYLAAVNTAGRALGARAGTIVVVTDLQETGWDAGDHASIPTDARVEVRDVGPLPDNLAVVGIRQEGGVVATVRNDSARTRSVGVRLTVDGRSAGERSVSVGPHGTADASFGAISGKEAVAVIDDAEGLGADNSRYASLASSSWTGPLAVTATGDLDRDAFYVHKALAPPGGAGRGSLEATGVAAGQIGSWSIERISAYSAVLLLSTRGLERRGRDLLASYVAGGGGLLIAAGPDVDGDVAADVAGASVRLRLVSPEERGSVTSQSLAPADVRHPIFLPFGPATASLGLVRFTRTARMNASGCQSLAKFTSGEAAVIDCGIGEGRAVVMASDLNNRWNDFPLHATFVPFLHETVRYLSNAHMKSGEYLVGEVPPGVKAAPGIVTIPATGTARPRRVAINVDPAESEPARISAEEFESAITRLKEAGAVEARNVERSRESSQHFWQYLLAAMMVTLAAEGVVARRTL
jgi:von Willebrand factor type A domain/Aerotolerance regulator N-terminal